MSAVRDLPTAARKCSPLTNKMRTAHQGPKVPTGTDLTFGTTTGRNSMEMARFDGYHLFEFDHCDGEVYRPVGQPVSPH
jgi:hypothetical protein